MKQSVYDLITRTKDALADMDFHLEYFDGNEFYYVRRDLFNLRKRNYNQAVALATILLTGSFIEDMYGYQFLMPATKDCLRNYKAVKKSMKKGEQLKFFVYPFNKDNYVFL